MAMTETELEMLKLRHFADSLRFMEDAIFRPQIKAESHDNMEMQRAAMESEEY